MRLNSRAGRFRTRSLRLLLAMVVAGLLLAAWVAWLGWPDPERVTGRVTPLASAEASEWIQAGHDLLTCSASVTGASGLTVNLRVLRPASGFDGPLPLVLLLGGQRTGSDAVTLIGHPGRLLVVALDYPYDGPARLRGVRQVASALPGIRDALLDTPAAITLALDWVLAQPWANPSRIELVGVSLGTQFVAPAGATDARFDRIWFVQGAGNSRDWLWHQLEERVAVRPVRSATAAALWWVAHGASLDPERWVAQIAPRRVVIVGARNDSRLPPSLVTRFHHAAEPPKRLEWIEGGHINPRRPETVRPVLDLILAEMEVDDEFVDTT